MDMIPNVPGTFCWAELGTSQTDGAKTFYSKLFGWKSEDSPMGPDSFYTMFKVDSVNIAGAYKQGEEEKGIPPHWNSYILVTNADEVAARVAQLGGKVLAGPFDVMEAGRMAVLQDSQGAVFHLWQPGKHETTRYANKPGTLCWNELVAHDENKARDFYSKLFGWTYKVESMGAAPYTVFMKDGIQVAGLMGMPKEWSSMPSCWGPYFAVADCDKSAQIAKENGGKVLVEPRDIPEVGRFAVIQDPQGAFFSILKLAKVA